MISFNLQRAKKVVSNSLGLVDFAIEPVNPVLDLPEGQVKFLGKFKLQKYVTNAAHQNFFGATLKTLGLVHASNNLPEWQTIKPTFLNFTSLLFDLVLVLKGEV